MAKADEKNGEITTAPMTQNTDVRVQIVQFNHPSGFFAGAESVWYGQDNENVADEEFWQFNVIAGYRFAQRRAEMAVAGLNLSDQDYRLNPINYHAELPRERTLLVSFKFNF